MLIYAIDPGNEESALVIYSTETRKILTAITHQNDTILSFIESNSITPDSTLVIEEFESFGMAVGREVFRTVWWSGRFYERWNGQRQMLPRRQVKLHICHSSRATDANIRAAIYDLYGGKLAAVGTKKAPGPLYGLKGHEYAALALAITAAEKKP